MSDGPSRNLNVLFATLVRTSQATRLREIDHAEGATRLRPDVV